MTITSRENDTNANNVMSNNMLQLQTVLKPVLEQAKKRTMSQFDCDVLTKVVPTRLAIFCSKRGLSADSNLADYIRDIICDKIIAGDIVPPADHDATHALRWAHYKIADLIQQVTRPNKIARGQIEKKDTNGNIIWTHKHASEFYQHLGSIGMVCDLDRPEQRDAKTRLLSEARRYARMRDKIKRKKEKRQKEKRQKEKSTIEVYANCCV